MKSSWKFGFGKNPPKASKTAGLDQLGPTKSYNYDTWLRDNHRVNGHTINARVASSAHHRHVTVTLPDMSQFLGGKSMGKPVRGLCDGCGHLRSIRQVERASDKKWVWLCKSCQKSDQTPDSIDPKGVLSEDGT